MNGRASRLIMQQFVVRLYRLKGPGSINFAKMATCPVATRTHLDGVPMHIVQRGHNREPCFFGEADYQTYLYWLGEALKKEHCALHAYALMTNHVHLIVPTPSPGSSLPLRGATCNTSTPPIAGHAVG